MAPLYTKTQREFLVPFIGRLYAKGVNISVLAYAVGVYPGVVKSWIRANGWLRDEDADCTAWDPSIVDAARTLSAGGFITNRALAKGLRISETTLQDWRKAHKELDAAILEGRKQAVEDTVLPKALKRAQGYYWREESVFTDKDGSVSHRVVRKHEPPHPQAQMNLMMNYGGWKNTKGEQELTGKDGAPLAAFVVNVHFTDLPLQDTLGAKLIEAPDV